MTTEAIAALVGSFGIPYAYHHFSEDSGQEPPFAVFYFEESADMYADDANYQNIMNLSIEVYTDNKDFALEKTVETALKGAGLTWTKTESYLDDEQMYEELYETTVIITEE